MPSRRAARHINRKSTDEFTQIGHWIADVVESMKSGTTECVPEDVFEFVTEGYTRWRYEFAGQDGATVLTESYSHPPYTGWKKFLYSTVARRSAGMVKGIEQTLARIKDTLEA